MPTGVGTRSPTPDGPDPGKPTRPARKPGTGPHAEFIAWWESEYIRTQGTAYVASWSREAPIVAKLLRALGPDELRARATRLLDPELTDAFLASTDRGIGVLSKQINRPVLRGAAASARAAGGNHDANMAALKRKLERSGRTHDGAA